MSTADTLKTKGFLSSLEKTASVGTLLKTLIGLVAAIVAASAAVYQHFAKSSELHALQCSVVDQAAINNQVIRTAEEVRTALTALKQNLDTPKDNPTSSKVLAEELSKAIGNIQSALQKINEARERIQMDTIKGERKC